MSDTQAYTFSSKPQAVQSRKAKGGYRQQQQQQQQFEDGEPVNIMFDPRVYRGSTYSRHTKDKLVAQEQAAQKRKIAARQRKAREGTQEAPQYASADEAPPPLPGRKDMDVQTDTYLEELTDRVPETEMETQTDAFMDRPALPLFLPTKTGVDAETQVDVDELFDFDAEVEPILEVLVGKTLEHAMMEVLEEEELDAIRKHQQQFEQERNVERAQVQRLEAESIRRNQERKRRITQEQERLQREAEVMDKVAARAFASDYLADLHSNVFDKLVESGQFFDPLIKEVEDSFLPWLIGAVQQRSDKRLVARSLLDDCIRATLAKAKAEMAKRLQAAEDLRQAEERRIAEEAEERRRAEMEQEDLAGAVAGEAGEAEEGEGGAEAGGDAADDEDAEGGDA